MTRARTTPHTHSLEMHDRENERSPLIGGTAIPAQEWGVAGRTDVAGRALLGDASYKRRRRGRTEIGDGSPRAMVLRNWRQISAVGVVGVLILLTALAGLAAILCAPKGQATPTNASTPVRMQEATGSREAPAASSERRERCEREPAGTRPFIVCVCFRLIYFGDSPSGQGETCAALCSVYLRTGRRGNAWSN